MPLLSAKPRSKKSHLVSAIIDNLTTSPTKSYLYWLDKKRAQFVDDTRRNVYFC